ncbi:hypothetical protein CHARACLAT_027223 [Characodon lateralis]|uniref:YEATS domain-containing protein n=1 Tax=Characodon lateralis TaxID=208331 RepID=A0ABU7EG56_9TELE|nr:hypothetical protein [Characodon lateralis]
MAGSGAVQVKLELGHRAQFRKKPTAEGFTHDWMVFVRGPENSNIQHFVEKVVFHLHESFPKPKRGRDPFTFLFALLFSAGSLFFLCWRGGGELSLKFHCCPGSKRACSLVFAHAINFSFACFHQIMQMNSAMRMLLHWCVFRVAY